MSKLHFRRLFFTTMMALLLALTTQSFTRGAEPEESSLAEKHVSARADFKSPITVDQALAVSQEADLQLEVFYHRYEVGQRIFSGGYIPSPGLTEVEIEQSYLSAHEGYINDVLQVIRSIQEAKTDSNIDSNTLAKDTLALSDAIHEQGVRVVGIEVEGTLTQIERLKDHPIIQRVRIRGTGSEPSTSSRSKISRTIQAAGAAWWPNSGSLATLDSSVSGKRFVWQSMRWDNDRLGTLKGFGTNTTYEPDAVYNNYDGQYYLGNDVDYWHSNHDHAYLDTRLFDHPEERVFTVGFSDVQGLEANTDYTTYIRTNFGNADNDTGKLNGQRGHRNPSWCHHPLCIAGDETEFIIPAWQHAVPGVTDWTH